MPPRSILGYVEDSLPGRDRQERARLAARLGLALEVANRGEVDPAPYARAGVAVVTVQAWGMHDHHPLHPDPARRAAAAAHLRDTIDLAARLGAPRVLAVCGYGPLSCGDPFDRCLEFFAASAPHARDRGVRILIEPLSRLRAPAAAGTEAVARLLAALALPEVFGAALDTGHLLDDRRDPGEVLASWGPEVEELQLRGPASVAPGPDLPLEAWLARLARPPAVLVVEHRAAIGSAELDALVERLRRLIAGHPPAIEPGRTEERGHNADSR